MKNKKKVFTKEDLIEAWTKAPFSEKIATQALSVLESFKKGEKSKEIEAFTIPLEFGTGGIRGVLGEGVGRMNEFPVGRAAHGLCKFLSSKSAITLKPLSLNFFLFL